MTWYWLTQSDLNWLSNFIETNTVLLTITLVLIVITLVALIIYLVIRHKRRREQAEKIENTLKLLQDIERQVHQSQNGDNQSK